MGGSFDPFPLNVHGLKTQIFTANVWLINDFASQLYRIFLKTNIFLKTERKKLIRNEFRT